MRILTLVITAMAFSSSVHAQTVPTFDRSDHGSASAPRAIAAADFDRDGWLDVATAGRSGVTVLLNTGGAGFAVRATPLPDAGAFDMAAGDLDGDATPDLVIAQADGNAVDILLGNGDGTFAAPRRVPIAGGNPRGVAIADYNGDGNLDVIVTEYATGAWRILYGDGAGAIARQDRFGAIAHPQGVLAADFNHDGRLDVAIAGAGINLVAVFVTTPAGIAQRNVTVGGAVNVLAAGDYNRDGWLDLSAASSSNNNIYTLHGSAAGLAWRVTTASASSPRGIVAADVNRDGRLDLMTANRASSTANVHLGNGTGSFAAARPVAAGSGSRAIVSGDFDHDGRIDLMTANEFASSTTLLRNATAFAAPAFRFTRQAFGNHPGSGGPYGVEAADFDRDGRIDAVVWAQDIDVWLNGKGKKTVATAVSVNDVAVADFNGDGAPDIAASAYWRKSVLVFINAGDGSFSELHEIGFFSPILSLTAGDFDGDGKSDIVAQGVSEGSGEGTFHVLLNRGGGTFARAPVSAPIPYVREMLTADIDRDGNLDVVGGSAIIDSFNFVVWYGNGDGTSSRAATYPLPRGGSDVAIGDLNEDGRLDLISAYDSWVYVSLALPAGGFAAPTEHPASIRMGAAFVYDITAADVNLDGHVDVVTNDADILYGTGTGSLTFDHRGALEGLYQDPKVADFNGDGLPDLLFNEGGGLIVMLNGLAAANRPPVVSAGRDLTVSYLAVNGYGDDSSIDATGSDPDLHELRYEWRDSQGRLMSNDQYFWPSNLAPGQHTFTVTVFDGRGGQASDSMVLTVEHFEEIYLHTDRFDEPRGAWRRQEDPAAASQTLLRHPDANAPKLAAALASPTNYVETSFPAEPGQVYKLWLRLKADGNHWANDSVFVQFEGATDENGNPIYQIGSTSALAVNLEECSGCGLSGWGWEDDGWGAVGRNGAARLRFPSGQGRIRIQTREDGVSIDQVVMSARRFLTTRPGAAKNDTTILPPTVPWY
jgi:hypothetical protein